MECNYQFLDQAGCGTRTVQYDHPANNNNSNLHTNSNNNNRMTISVVPSQRLDLLDGIKSRPPMKTCSTVPVDAHDKSVYTTALPSNQSKGGVRRTGQFVLIHPKDFVVESTPAQSSKQRGSPPNATTDVNQPCLTFLPRLASEASVAVAMLLLWTKLALALYNCFVMHRMPSPRHEKETCRTDWTNN